MHSRTQVVAIAALTLPIYGILLYVASGHIPLEMHVLALVISASVAYLFYEALSCRRVRPNLLQINLRRKLDLKEVSRIFGAVSLLPAAAIIMSQQSIRSAVQPLKLYVLFVLLFLAGWALGTVETAKFIESEEPDHAKKAHEESRKQAHR